MLNNSFAVCGLFLLVAGIIFFDSSSQTLAAEKDETKRLLSFSGISRALTGASSAEENDAPNPAVNKQSEQNVVTPPKKPGHSDISGAAIFSYTDFAQKDAPPPRLKPVTKGTAPLSEETARLYKKIFTAQQSGRIKEANEIFERLEDMRLRGHVLAQRYLHPTAYVSEFEELINWLTLYPDHPAAAKIYDLAHAKKSSGWRGKIPKPEISQGVSGYLESGNDRARTYVSSQKRTAAQRKQIDRLSRKVKRYASRGAPTKALSVLESSDSAKWLDHTEYDTLRGHIAYGYLHAGKNDKAYELGSASSRRSGIKVPLGGWVAGLIAWQRGKYQESARYFETTAQSPYATGWTIAGAAYWASRANMRAGNVRDVSRWLETAATYPRTFYGLIATRALGRDFDFNWDLPEAREETLKNFSNHPSIWRARALMQSGQFDMAEAEMQQIDPGEDRVLQEALIAYAAQNGLPSFAIKLANAIPYPEGGLYDAALYPVVPWQPEKGFNVDLALIHAMIRQESRFNPDAENRSGATGLMQLMPRTAGYIAGERTDQDTLKDPVLNIEIGQQYIYALLNQNSVSGDLFSLAIAYNAGPGNLARWKKRLSRIDDPLLFIESIPVAETRAYVERVMANYWIYRMRFGQPTPTLDAVASGRWAMYAEAESAASYKIADL